MNCSGKYCSCVGRVKVTIRASSGCFFRCTLVKQAGSHLRRWAGIRHQCHISVTLRPKKLMANSWHKSRALSGSDGLVSVNSVYNCCSYSMKYKKASLQVFKEMTDSLPVKVNCHLLNVAPLYVRTSVHSDGSLLGSCMQLTSEVMLACFSTKHARYTFRFCATHNKWVNYHLLGCRVHWETGICIFKQGDEKTGHRNELLCKNTAFRLWCVV